MLPQPLMALESSSVTLLMKTMMWVKQADPAVNT
jgi:hypothetical protein